MKATDSHINKELFVRLGQGDVQAFRELFHYYTPRLHPFVGNIAKSQAVAEEIVQDVFLKLWHHRKEVAEKDNPSSWLFTVAANATYTYLKRVSYEKRFIEYVKQLGNNQADATASPSEELLLSKEKEMLLQEAVESLPPQRKLIFRLSRTKGLSHKEIANQLYISPNTVRNQLHSAVRSIKEYLRKAGVFFLCLAALLFFLI